MKAPLRALPLALCMIPASPAADAIPSSGAAAEAAWPAIFAPREGRPAVAPSLLPPAPKRPSLVSEFTRTLLAQKIAAIELPAAGASLSNVRTLLFAADNEPLMMTRFVVTERKAESTPLKIDESPLWRYLKTGTVYSHVGRKVDFAMSLYPITVQTRGLQPQIGEGVELAFRLRW